MIILSDVSQVSECCPCNSAKISQFFIVQDFSGQAVY